MFASGAVDEARRRVGAALRERGTVTVADVRDLLGSTRKYVLPILSQAGNADRLVAEARRFLSADPEDLDAHFYLVMGHCNLRQFAHAERHVRELLRLEPESVNTHIAAVRFRSSSASS